MILSGKEVADVLHLLKDRYLAGVLSDSRCLLVRAMKCVLIDITNSG